MVKSQNLSYTTEANGNKTRRETSGNVEREREYLNTKLIRSKQIGRTDVSETYIRT
jgi:hypothetical protein